MVTGGPIMLDREGPENVLTISSKSPKILYKEESKECKERNREQHLSGCTVTSALIGWPGFM